MSTKQPADADSAGADAAYDAVLVVDTFAHFQPIRLPAAGFYRLHRDTERELSAFVFDHLRRFPQVARGAKPKRLR